MARSSGAAAALHVPSAKANTSWSDQCITKSAKPAPVWVDAQDLVVREIRVGAEADRAVARLDSGRGLPGPACVAIPKAPPAASPPPFDPSCVALATFPVLRHGCEHVALPGERHKPGTSQNGYVGVALQAASCAALQVKKQISLHYAFLL